MYDEVVNLDDYKETIEKIAYFCLEKLSHKPSIIYLI